MPNKPQALLLIPILIFLDWATKTLASNVDIELIPNFFYLAASKNPGVIFGFFPKNIFITILLPILLILILAFYFKKESSKFSITGLAFIISGLLGNLLDRILYGHVIDFIYFKIIPKYSISLFNLADSYVVIGLILIIYATFRNK